MTSLDFYRLTVRARPARAWPRGLGLAAGALASLLMWAGLIRLALALIGG